LRAEEATAKLIGEGWAVICPHKITENLQGLYPDEVYLDICMELLRRSDAIYMLKGWRESEGSIMEFNVAKDAQMEIYFEEGG